MPKETSLCVLFFFLFLPPANEVCEGYVFTGVCLSTGVSAPLHAGIHPPGRHPRVETHTPWADPPGQTDSPLLGRHPHPPEQTPHWNAFLFWAMQSLLSWNILKRDLSAYKSQKLFSCLQINVEKVLIYETAKEGLCVRFNNRQYFPVPIAWSYLK